ncbi:MAG: hypothetical protein M3O36_16045, partial [Myxococcota bacterium]|nr:hypothetical protein [Myxococcota bacterium]
MCAGALVNARISRLVYGCLNPNAGAVRTLFSIVADPRLNHRVEAIGGVLGQECAGLLRDFFGRMRVDAQQGLSTADQRHSRYHSQ